MEPRSERPLTRSLFPSEPHLSVSLGDVCHFLGKINVHLNSEGLFGHGEKLVNGYGTTTSLCDLKRVTFPLWALAAPPHAYLERAGMASPTGRSYSNFARSHPACKVTQPLISPGRSRSFFRSWSDVWISGSFLPLTLPPSCTTHNFCALLFPLRAFPQDCVWLTPPSGQRPSLVPFPSLPTRGERPPLLSYSSLFHNPVHTFTVLTTV